jgi:hypothetical protein
VILANVAADLLAEVLDPRVRAGGRRGAQLGVGD